MRVHVADKAGACYGVERALKLVERAAQDQPHVSTLGPLIHNPLVVSSLEAQGVSVASTPEEINEGAAVIRSHGVPKEVEQKLRDRGLSIVDATCPFVKRAHVRAQELAEQGYFVLIVGDEGHAEVEGISSYVGEKLLVTSSVEELKAHKLGPKVGIVVQTTQSQKTLEAMVCYLTPICSELRIFNTICAATQERQAAAAYLASKVQAMIVVGGKNSGNTKRLYEICKDACEHTYHIEAASELKPEWLKGISDCGVTAGASTPASHIDAVVQALLDMSEGLEPAGAENPNVTAGTAGTADSKAAASPTNTSTTL